MSTHIRSKLSRRNKYYISKERYLELKHFCLQYGEWKQKRVELAQSMGLSAIPIERLPVGSDISDKTAIAAIELNRFRDKMELVEFISTVTDREIGSYIFTAVTEGMSYQTLLAQFEVPFGKDMFYDRYRKFFFLLDEARE